MRGGRARVDDGCCGSFSFNDRSKLTKITDPNTLETIGYITSLGAAAQMMIAATFGCGATSGSTGRRVAHMVRRRFTIFVLVYITAPISGGHINPGARVRLAAKLCCGKGADSHARACAAITFGLTIARRVTLLRGVLYVIVQARRCVREASCTACALTHPAVLRRDCGLLAQQESGEEHVRPRRRRRQRLAPLHQRTSGVRTMLRPGSGALSSSRPLHALAFRRSRRSS